MKPLTNIDEFLQRFDNFRDAEFRSLDIKTPSQMLVSFGVQDSARGFDWISIDLEFNGVSDARILENSKLSLVDMNDGISIVKDADIIAFGIGDCYNISNIKNSTCYFICKDIKYQEKNF